MSEFKTKTIQSNQDTLVNIKSANRKYQNDLDYIMDVINPLL